MQRLFKAVPIGHKTGRTAAFHQRSCLIIQTQFSIHKCGNTPPSLDRSSQTTVKYPPSQESISHQKQIPLPQTGILSEVPVRSLQTRSRPGGNPGKGPYS